jgi:hypothetical protein
MKKTIIIIGLMFSLALSAFCQLKELPKYSDGVLSIDGNNWTNLNYDTKYGFVVGVFWSFDTIREYILRTHNDEDFKSFLVNTYGEVSALTVGKYMEDLYSWCFFEGDATNILTVLDRAYSYKENLNYQVIEVLLIEYNKAWWRKKEEKVKLVFLEKSEKL